VWLVCLTRYVSRIFRRTILRANFTESVAYFLYRLGKKSPIQLICAGPVIDLHGRFTAEKLAHLVEICSDRIFSKPGFTALPPFLFSGTDFALIPSRDEPFGLVAVEFDRKGALGVGARLGGLVG
jgi:alpha-1,3-glucan synthase